MRYELKHWTNQVGMGNTACVATGGTPHKVELKIVNNTELILQLDTTQDCGRGCDHKGWQVAAGKIVAGQEPPEAIQPFSSEQFSVSGREASAVAPNGKVFYENAGAELKIALGWTCSGWTAPGGSSIISVIISGERDGKAWEESLAGDVDMDNWVVTLRYRLVVEGCNIFIPDEAEEVTIKVMTLNTWGMPGSFGGRDKSVRMEAIGGKIAAGEYDMVLLQELWMRVDHRSIQQQLGPSLYMTEFDDLNPVDADGKVSPWGCSGLAIVSRFPIISKKFSKFKKQGCSSMMFVDGEHFSGKGVGEVRVSPAPGIHLDVFVTHLISMVSNAPLREAQTEQLLSLINSSTSDFIILGGDFNISRVRKGEQTYHKIIEEMTDTMEAECWADPNLATYGNNRNTYSKQEEPVVYDYIFYRKNTQVPSMIWTESLEVPFLGTVSSNDNSIISISDHEAVSCHIHFSKQ